MIKVTIKSNNGKVNYLSVTGHANSDAYGKDLVCAGVSSVITGAFNNLLDTKNLKLVLKEGNASLEVLKGELSEHDQIVIETLITGLKTIRESNPKSIEIENF